MSNKIYPSLACRLEFFAEDADGLPVTGLTHSDVSAAGYCRIQDGVMSSTTSLSLTSSAAYTAAVSSGQFITINSSRGHYAIDCPSGASAIAYDYALADVTFTAGHNVYAIRHEIDATLQIVTSNNATLGALSGRIPASLVSGRMDCSVGAMANDVVTAAAIASNALSIAKFAADIGTTAYASNPLAKAVWERLLSAMTTAGSAGKKLSDQANADVSALALQSTLNAVGVLATAIDAKTSQLAFTTPNKVDASAVLDSADQTEVLDAVTAANAKLDSIALKTALINAGRLRVLSRVAGNVIKAHAGDDHLILAENALTLEVDDDDASLYALLTAGTNQNLKFGAGRASDTDADEISATIPAANVRHVGTSTFVDIELPSAATAGRRGEYEFDIQITNAAGYKITPQQLQGTLMIEVDRKS